MLNFVFYLLSVLVLGIVFFFIQVAAFRLLFSLSDLPVYYFYHTCLKLNCTGILVESASQSPANTGSGVDQKESSCWSPIVTMASFTLLN
jgi:hypothetical protein